MVVARKGEGEAMGQLEGAAKEAREDVVALPAPTATLPEGNAQGTPQIEAPGHDPALERAEAVVARAGAAGGEDGVDPAPATQ